MLAFVTSRLDYCNSLLYGLPAYQLQKRQRVQNAVARLICNIYRFDHITSALYELHWLPVKYRIDFKILLITYKALNGLAATYIAEFIQVKPVSRYSLGTSHQPLLQLPSVRTLATLIGDRSFSVGAPKLWNSLPSNIHKASLPRSRSLSRHATLLPTNGCSHSNNIPFPLFLRSNEGANHVSAN